MPFPDKAGRDASRYVWKSQRKGAVCFSSFTDNHTPMTECTAQGHMISTPTNRELAERLLGSPGQFRETQQSCADWTESDVLLSFTGSDASRHASLCLLRWNQSAGCLVDFLFLTISAIELARFPSSVTKPCLRLRLPLKPLTFG